jgi:hypothetical protein
VPAPTPQTFAGTIVACERGGNGRTDKGLNVLRGGAVGMILYNPTPADTAADNHWLPTVQLADGAAFKAFLTAHPGATASFPAGRAVDGQGDVMGTFSARGPNGRFIKPDVTAPGVQILAGHTPTPESANNGPSGQYFQVVTGTSMSAPEVAGAAVLIKALHPGWSPGQIKSALMTTATTKVVKEDRKTPADPFDDGAGRIQVNLAGNPGLTFDESAERLGASVQGDGLNAVNLNLPSINAPVMPGRLTTVRRAVNVTDKVQTYRTEVTAPAGSTITVTPPVFGVAPGRSAQISVTIRSSAPKGQYFGEVRLIPTRPGNGLPVLHLPVAFVPQPGVVALTSTCVPESVQLGATTTCTVTAANTGAQDALVSLRTTTGLGLTVTGAHVTSAKSPAKSPAAGPLAAAPVAATPDVGPHRVEISGVTLPGPRAGVPSLRPSGQTGYVSLDGIATFTAVGDEEIVNHDVAAFRYNGVTYSRIGVTTNGYVVAGGGTADDVRRTPSGIGVARPNNYLAPFWTDLTGRAPEGSGQPAAPGIAVVTVNDDTEEWVVVEWRLYLAGTTDLRTFQLWIGTTRLGTPDQDICYGYAVPHLADPGMPYLVGAENGDGTGGEALPDGALPTGEIRVVSSEPTPAGWYSYTVTAHSRFPGSYPVTTTMDSPQVPGQSVASTTVTVAGRRAGSGQQSS